MQNVSASGAASCMSSVAVWLQNVASDAFTFEAWIRTTDFCHRGEQVCLDGLGTYISHVAVSHDLGH